MISYALGFLVCLGFTYPPYDWIGKILLIVLFIDYALRFRIPFAPFCWAVIIASVSTGLLFRFGSAYQVKLLAAQIVYFFGSLGLAKFIMLHVDVQKFFLSVSIFLLTPFILGIQELLHFDFGLSMSSLNGLTSTLADNWILPTYKHLMSALVLLWILLFLISYSQSKNQIIHWLIFPAVAIVSASSRTLSLAVVTCFLTSSVKSRLLRCIVLLLVSCGGIAYVLFFSQTEAPYRKLAWREVIRGLMEENFLGLGPGISHFLLEREDPNFQFIQNMWVFDQKGFESGFFWFLSDFGWFGLVIWIGILANLYMFDSKRIRNFAKNRSSVDWIAPLFIFCVFSNHLCQPYFWVLIGVVVGVLNKNYARIRV